MHWFHVADTVTRTAGIVCLPLAIPGYLAAVSESVRGFMAARRWIPRTLITIIAALFVVELGAPFNQFSRERPQLKNEYGKVFDSVVVTLDGRGFYDCVFNNVTFRWNGGKSYLHNPRISGARGFQTTDERITLTVDLFKLLGFLNPQFALYWHHRPLPPG